MTVRDRLENWAEAARWGTGGHGGSHIGSAEGRYRIKPGEDDDAPPRVIRPEPDWTDADVVDAAWKTLAPRYKWLLKFLYINNSPVSFICRKCGIRQRPQTVFDLERSRAETAIEKRLVNALPLAYNRGKFDSGPSE